MALEYRWVVKIQFLLMIVKVGDWEKLVLHRVWCL